MDIRSALKEAKRRFLRKRDLVSELAVRVVQPDEIITPMRFDITRNDLRSAFRNAPYINPGRAKKVIINSEGQKNGVITPPDLIGDEGRKS